MGSKNDKRPKLTDLSTLSNFMTSLTARLGGKCWQVKFPPPSTPASAKGALPDPYTHKRFFNLREEGSVINFVCAHVKSDTFDRPWTLCDGI
jgi:hypothetical protein